MALRQLIEFEDEELNARAVSGSHLESREALVKSRQMRQVVQEACLLSAEGSDKDASMRNLVISAAQTLVGWAAPPEHSAAGGASGPVSRSWRPSTWLEPQPATGTQWHEAKMKEALTFMRNCENCTKLAIRVGMVQVLVHGAESYHHECGGGTKPGNVQMSRHDCSAVIAML